jgi:hypothetical protein
MGMTGLGGTLAGTWIEGDGEGAVLSETGGLVVAFVCVGFSEAVGLLAAVVTVWS